MLAIQNYIIITGNTCFSEMKSLTVFCPEMAMFLYVTFRKCFKMKAFNRHPGWGGGGGGECLARL